MDFEEFKRKFEKVTAEHYPHQVKDEPVVSVCVQTYQHGKFIADCLEGILMQQTNFFFEILVGEDGSDDGTREVCIQYAKKYPGKIRLFLHKKENNIIIGGARSGRFNFLYNLYSARGEYVALCEGDDYWTDPSKLEKQVDVLRSSRSHSLCAHNASLLNYSTGMITQIQPGFKERQEVTVDELIRANPFFTASLMFRKDILSPVPEWFKKLPFGDYGILFLSAARGRITCLPEVMSTYRVHAGGIHGNLYTSPSGTLKAINKHIVFFCIVGRRVFKGSSFEFHIFEKIISLHRRKLEIYKKQKSLLGLLKTKAKINFLQLIVNTRAVLR